MLCTAHNTLFGDVDMVISNAGIVWMVTYMVLVIDWLQVWNRLKASCRRESNGQNPHKCNLEQNVR